MSVPIIVDLVPKSKRPGYAMKPEYLTIHQTGNTNPGADAKMHNRYVHNNAPNPSWHFTVDDKVIYQHLPLNENGWHAGDGANGPGNRQSIGIEICENRDGNRAAAEANAAWLVAKLLKDYGLGLDRVKQHYDWSGKNCPRVLRGRKDGWKNFLAAVEAHLKPAPKLPAITRTIGIYVDGKKVDEVGYLINNATYVRAAYVVGLAGGEVTGHGDHIKITLPPKADPAAIKALEAEIAALKGKIANAKKALS